MFFPRPAILFALLTPAAAAQSWSAAHPDLPGGSDSYALAVAEESGENQIFLMGGYDGAVLDEVWRFHRTYGWSLLGDMPGARRKAAAGTLDGSGSQRIHLVGGGHGATLATTTHWAYDPLTDTWDTSPAPMVKALYDMEAVAAPDGKLYVFGGIGSTGATSNTTQIYDPATDSWSAGYYMPQKRTRFAAVADCDGYIYLFGGIDGATYRATVECFDTSSNTWLDENPHTEEAFPDVPTLRDDLAGALGRDGRIYLTGGTSSTSPAALNLVEVFDPYENSWSTEAPMLVARSSHRAVGLGSRVWTPSGVSHGATRPVSLESYGALSSMGACADDVPSLPLLHGGLGMTSATPLDLATSIVDFEIGFAHSEWFFVDLAAHTTSVLDLEVTGQGALGMRVFDGGNHLVAAGSASQPVALGGPNAGASRYFLQVRNDGPAQQPVQYSLFVTSNVDPRPVGEVYASPAVASSTGAPASIAAEGFQLASANDLQLSVVGLPQQSSGYFLVSSQAGSIVNPGTATGVLPLAGSIGRFAGNVLNAGAAGEVSLAVDLTQLPGNPPVAAQSGQTWHFTYWYRDAGPNGATSNFSDGLRVTFD